jgi:hypothetical protein
MSTIEITGYRRDNEGVFISKDALARLTYRMDWAQWRIGEDTIATVNYTIQQRTNDANPVIRHDQGVVTGRYTFVELSGGTVGRTYVITADITTTEGLRDRRNFRVKIENRSA